MVADRSIPEGGIGRRWRIGIDVGGTFTDVVLVDEADGEILVAKVPTVPDDPSEGCVDGFDRALSANGIPAAAIAFAVHGTTIATNTIIQGKGARTGLVTSEGFRDVLEIAYQTRPSLYDVFYDKPKPLVPRHLVIGVPERMGPDDDVLVPLDEDAVRSAGRRLAAAGVEAITVAFLHAYRSPAHERRAGEILAETCPGIAIVLSSEVCPEFREYPRTSTAVVNAVLIPRVSPYVGNLERRLSERGLGAGLHLMTSSGGIVTAAIAKREPVTLIESGPAAGVIGATFVAGLAGFENLLALDIGGTTAKAAIVTGGVPQVSDQFEVGAQAVATVTAHRGQGYPVRTPVLSLVEVGAGGGSIAHVDPGGALAVGPESAGAVPGPACYATGGTEPTLTDANLLLGSIDPAFFLGGAKSLDRAAAERAVATRVAAPMGLSVPEAARAIVAIANARMTSALHFISIQQGIDPRGYVLVASGGAGPMQAVEIARALGVRRVLIPPTPGLNSAVGLLATDLKHEQVRTVMRAAADARDADIAASLDEMAAAVRRILADEDVPADRTTVLRQLDMSYVGQSFALRVDVPEDAREGLVAAAAERFHGLHREAYGFSDPGEATHVASLRVVGIGRVDRPRLRALPPAEGSPDRAVKGRRAVRFADPSEPVDTPVYDRARLMAGDAFDGPAIVEQMDTTTVVPPGARVSVDRVGNLVIETGAA